MKIGWFFEFAGCSFAETAFMDRKHWRSWFNSDWKTGNLGSMFYVNIKTMASKLNQTSRLCTIRLRQNQSRQYRNICSSSPVKTTDVNIWSPVWSAAESQIHQNSAYIQFSINLLSKHVRNIIIWGDEFAKHRFIAVSLPFSLLANLLCNKSAIKAFALTSNPTSWKIAFLESNEAC